MAFAQPGGGLSPRPNIKGEAPAWNPNTGGVPKRKPPPSGHFAVGRPAVEEAESAGSGGDDYVSPAPMQQQKKKPGPKPKPKAPVDAVAAAPLPAPAVLAIRAPRPPPPPTSKGPDDDFQLDYIRDSLLPALVKHTSAAPFREPVDPVALNIPHYPAIITHPMDLGTVEKKLRDGEYLTGLQCLYDIMLVFNNCRTFNPAGDPILLTCHRLEQHFNALLKRMPVSPPPSKIRFEKQFCPHCGDLRSQSSFKQHRTLFYRENGYWERHPVEL
eukprot:comp11284_c0_seq1/m.5699 comp11284_c0_seq1/g.5699  ORF comp11284_c0_seq1/g.5699 comp11284_c0_seq1/m.5699 type:complete len:271 (-) comp11284_c0_seq1:464-1276(-)